MDKGYEQFSSHLTIRQNDADDVSHSHSVWWKYFIIFFEKKLFMCAHRIYWHYTYFTAKFFPQYNVQILTYDVECVSDI